IQFVCTSHSPQVIGEVLPEEVRLLDEQRVERPAQSFGMDSNWILQVLMGTDYQDSKVTQDLKRVFKLIEERKLREAEAEVVKLRGTVGNNEAIQRAASTIERVRMLGK